MEKGVFEKQNKISIEKAENGYIIDVNGLKSVATSKHHVGAIIGMLFTDNLKMIDEKKVYFDVVARVVKSE